MFYSLEMYNHVYNKSFMYLKLFIGAQILKQINLIFIVKDTNFCPCFASLDKFRRKYSWSRKHLAYQEQYQGVSLCHQYQTTWLWTPFDWNTNKKCTITVYSYM